MTPARDHEQRADHVLGLTWVSQETKANQKIVTMDNIDVISQTTLTK